VTRDDMPFGGSVQQVTYAGLPLYRFIFDEEPGETEGANLFDNVTSPTGTWYLVDPSRGRPATGQAHLQLETAPVGGLSADGGPKSACEGICALYWQPVLTEGRASAGLDVDQHAVGIIVRADGTHQVTYNGKPLYLFVGDAYIGGVLNIGGPASINGAGATTPWGVFNTIPLAP
jgi:predicted lipoprotein with Yx(FWY)xxD motif